MLFELFQVRYEYKLSSLGVVCAPFVFYFILSQAQRISVYYRDIMNRIVLAAVQWDQECLVRSELKCFRVFSVSVC
jgi:hypothetical protein